MKGFEIGGDDDDLGFAMQFERKDHPPRAHKGSISINQLAPRLRREERTIQEE